MPRPKGKKNHKPTALNKQRVLDLVKMGMAIDRVAIELKIAVHTLYKHYREQIDEGINKRHLFVLGKFMQGIKEGDRAYTIFYIKTQMGWKETNHLEVSGPNGQPIEYVERPKTVELDQWADYWSKTREERNKPFEIDHEQ